MSAWAGQQLRARSCAACGRGKQAHPWLTEVPQHAWPAVPPAASARPAWPPASSPAAPGRRGRRSPPPPVRLRGSAQPPGWTTGAPAPGARSARGDDENGGCDELAPQRRRMHARYTRHAALSSTRLHLALHPLQLLLHCSQVRAPRGLLLAKLLQGRAALPARLGACGCACGVCACGAAVSTTQRPWWPSRTRCTQGLPSG